MDLDDLAASWRCRRRAEETDLRVLAEELRSSACRAARVLVEQYGATEVWLFGSLSSGRVHRASDIDLAVSGVPDAVWFQALDRACLAAGRTIDLVPLETCQPSLSGRVRARGVRLDADQG